MLCSLSTLFLVLPWFSTLCPLITLLRLSLVPLPSSPSDLHLRPCCSLPLLFTLCLTFLEHKVLSSHGNCCRCCFSFVSALFNLVSSGCLTGRFSLVSSCFARLPGFFRLTFFGNGDHSLATRGRSTQFPAGYTTWQRNFAADQSWSPSLCKLLGGART